MKIHWTNRYSQTSQPDKYGRWARVGCLHRNQGHPGHPGNSLEIAWISQYGGKFLARLNISNGKFMKHCDTERDAKIYCQKALEEFVNDYLKIKT